MNQQQQHQEKAIEKLTERGWLQKHEQMVAKGESIPWRNFHMLKRFDGNVDEAFKQIALNNDEKKAKRQNCTNALEKLGYVEQNQYLEKKGFDRVPRNLKVLVQFNGDVLKAEQFLLERGNEHEGGHRWGRRDCSEHKRHHSGGPRKGRRGSRSFSKGRHCHFEEKIAEKYPVQMEKLKELGFEDLRKVCKLLRKFDGNLEEVLGKLLKCREERKALRVQSIKLNPEFKEKKKQLKSKLEKLKEKGLKKKQGIKFLAMWNGDVDKVIELIGGTPQQETQTQKQN